MGDALIGLGVLLAIFGPLLLIPVGWLLYRSVWWALVRWISPERLTSRTARQVAAALAMAIVLGALLGSYLPGRWEFDRLCAQHSVPDASFRTKVDGFYRAQMFSYQARTYLDEGPFSFVEAPHPYRKGINVRYSKGANGEVVEQQIPSISSAYGFRETFSQLPGGITMTEKLIYDIAGNRELARAASLSYQGGPLSIFLGTLGMSSCPDVLTETGSRHFTTFYNLESIVLGGKAVP